MDKAKQTFTKVYGTTRDRWVGIAPRTRIIILAIAGVIVASAIILTIMLNNTGYTLLYKAGTADEMNEVINVLISMGHTDVRTTADYKIMVPSNTENDLRMRLSSQGYPRPGFNNDVWGTITMFSTNYDRRQAEKMQLQSWLTATYNTLPDVDYAIVILNIPNTSGYSFIENREEASATIKLNLRTGRTLDSSQIEGVRNMARTAVPGLEAHNITVTDTFGIELFPDDMSGWGGESLSLDQQRYALERDYKRLMTETLNGQINAILTGVFGRYTATANVTLDFSDMHTQEVIYTPIEGLDGGIIRNIREQYAAGGILAEGGPVGTFVNSNISPDYPTIPDIEAGSEFYQEYLREINYEINELRREFTEKGFRVSGISASVVVDSTVMAPNDIEIWRKIIADAISADIENVSFHAQPFPISPQDRPTGEGVGNNTSTRNLLIYIIICLGALLIILFALAMATSGSRKKRQVRYRGAPPVTEMGQYIRDDIYVPAPEAAEGFDLPSLLDNETETKDVVLRREIKEFSKSNPEIIAQLIRTWLRGEEN
ncbi:MAG: hypothetical protein FWD34_03325 [Oscillospiraceae bacterium]|nr:hypothetical protein [Oscillospiraceae bacterium]